MARRRGSLILGLLHGPMAEGTPGGRHRVGAAPGSGPRTSGNLAGSRFVLKESGEGSMTMECRQLVCSRLLVAAVAAAATLAVAAPSAAAVGNPGPEALLPARPGPGWENATPSPARSRPPAESLADLSEALRSSPAALFVVVRHGHYQFPDPGDLADVACGSSVVAPAHLPEAPETTTTGQGAATLQGAVQCRYGAMAITAVPSAESDSALHRPLVWAGLGLIVVLVIALIALLRRDRRRAPPHPVVDGPPAPPQAAHIGPSAEAVTRLGNARAANGDPPLPLQSTAPAAVPLTEPGPATGGADGDSAWAPGPVPQVARDDARPPWAESGATGRTARRTPSKRPALRTASRTPPRPTPSRRRPPPTPFRRRPRWPPCRRPPLPTRSRRSPPRSLSRRPPRRPPTDSRFRPPRIPGHPRPPSDGTGIPTTERSCGSGTGGPGHWAAAGTAGPGWTSDRQSCPDRPIRLARLWTRRSMQPAAPGRTRHVRAARPQESGRRDPTQP